MKKDFIENAFVIIFLLLFVAVTIIVILIGDMEILTGLIMTWAMLILTAFSYRSRGER